MCTPEEPGISSLPAWLQCLPQLSLCPAKPRGHLEMGSRWVISVQLLLVLARLVLCSPPGRVGP